MGSLSAAELMALRGLISQQQHSYKQVLLGGTGPPAPSNLNSTQRGTGPNWTCPTCGLGGNWPTRLCCRGCGAFWSPHQRATLSKKGHGKGQQGTPAPSQKTAGSAAHQATGQGKGSGTTGPPGAKQEQDPHKKALQALRASLQAAKGLQGPGGDLVRTELQKQLTEAQEAANRVRPLAVQLKAAKDREAARAKQFSKAEATLIEAREALEKAEHALMEARAAAEAAKADRERLEAEAAQEDDAPMSGTPATATVHPRLAEVAATKARCLAAQHGGLAEDYMQNVVDFVATALQAMPTSNKRRAPDTPAEQNLLE
jgi:hypothetical protein